VQVRRSALGGTFVRDRQPAATPGRLHAATAAACSQLTGLAGSPAVVFFGNNPEGRPAISGQAHGDVMLGFPGVGGAMRDGTAEYVRIPQQPTALQAGTDTRLDQLARALGTGGFAVQRLADMDGWLAYHAAFVACSSGPCRTGRAAVLQDLGHRAGHLRALTVPFQVRDPDL
jgi:hypothetical protein